MKQVSSITTQSWETSLALVGVAPKTNVGKLTGSAQVTQEGLGED